ncbi:nitrate reductase (NADH) [Alloactinosynnema sp. L-07]|uniref:sulfite oxidase n=1 Tax=Alloactinosynnema sp. L-07 TaxID=1653480 RepID=UPI00065EF93F|nr:sulfite oxidase [Alloactinosynnema sp. L-07]CRK59122.1 nitrate reductase (NADH) [Alloactinosynnema sp. L-07]
MTTPTVRPGEASRIADPDEGISLDELRLAARNHGMPLEALRYDLTPPGLHYVLVHYDIPFVDSATWRLAVDGRVRTPLELDLAALRDRPSVDLTVTLECAGNGRARLHPRPVSQPWLDEAVGTARWTGTPLVGLLADAGLLDDAVDVVCTGLDHGSDRGVEQDYQRGLAVTELADVLVAYEMNGQPLPPQHGAPARLIVPGWYGMASVKWLSRITVLAEKFTGFQNEVAYRIKADRESHGEPVTRIKPRALMVPPGFPAFMTRRRIVEAGPVDLFGRAWCGTGVVSRVEVSVDNGLTWADADLGGAGSRYAWRSWSLRWAASPGDTVLMARATAEGVTQPVEQPWNTLGMTNNMAQRIPVTVR